MWTQHQSYFHMLELFLDYAERAERQKHPIIYMKMHAQNALSNITNVTSDPCKWKNLGQNIKPCTKVPIYSWKPSTTQKAHGHMAFDKRHPLMKARAGLKGDIINAVHSNMKLLILEGTFVMDILISWQHLWRKFKAYLLCVGGVRCDAMGQMTHRVSAVTLWDRWHTPNTPYALLYISSLHRS